jgi:mannose-6-phosphate isomerase
MTLHDIAGKLELDRSMLDSFIIYIALLGDVTIVADGVEELLHEGEVVLIPAETCDVEILGQGRVMEVYIETK